MSAIIDDLLRILPLQSSSWSGIAIEHSAKEASFAEELIESIDQCLNLEALACRLMHCSDSAKYDSLCSFVWKWLPR